MLPWVTRVPLHSKQSRTTRYRTPKTLAGADDLMGKLRRSLKVVFVFIKEGTKPNIYQAPTAFKPFLYFTSVTLPDPATR